MLKHLSVDAVYTQKWFQIAHFYIPGWLAKVLFSDVRWLFVKEIEQTKHKETSKLCITGPLCIESFGDPLIPQTKGQ